MSGWMETGGAAMQAAGAVVAAAQVALFGLGGRAHAERTAPGDRLAAWLARMSKSEERLALVALIPRMRASSSEGVRLAYFAGFAMYVAACMAFVVVFTGSVWLGVYLLYQLLGPAIEPIEAWNASLPGVIRAVVGFALGVGLLVALMRLVGFVLVNALAILGYVLRRCGLLLLGVVLWLGRHLETTLRWAALLFGLGAVIEFAGRF